MTLKPTTYRSFPQLAYGEGHFCGRLFSLRPASLLISNERGSAIQGARTNVALGILQSRRSELVGDRPLWVTIGPLVHLLTVVDSFRHLQSIPRRLERGESDDLWT